MMQFTAIKPRHSPPFSCEDGGGIPSQPDWSLSNRCQCDVFKELRAKFFRSILDRKLHLRFLHHVDSKRPTAPFGHE